MYSLPAFLVAFIVFVLAYTMAHGTNLVSVILQTPR